MALPITGFPLFHSALDEVLEAQKSTLLTLLALLCLFSALMESYCGDSKSDTFNPAKLVVGGLLFPFEGEFCEGVEFDILLLLSDNVEAKEVIEEL